MFIRSQIETEMLFGFILSIMASARKKQRTVKKEVDIIMLEIAEEIAMSSAVPSDVVPPAEAGCETDEDFDLGK